MTGKLRHGSLFSGVGGVDLGLEWAGFETVWQVEIDPFARRVLEQRWPGVGRLDDVRYCGKHNLEPVDIISGGFPCVDVSIAGKRRGLGTADRPTDRSGLWFEYRRIVSELRPRWVLIENVSRLLDTADGEMVLDGLEEIGYSWWTQLLDAGALGAPHRRERVWILCHDGSRAHCDLEAVMAEAGVLPPECQRRMEEALGRWDYWKQELGRGAAAGCPAVTTTPTATAVLEAQWPGGRMHQNPEGRWRKRSKRGIEGSASWPQEMLVRAVVQRNPRLVPTPESCEDFMGFPRGWTCLAGEATALPEELAAGWDGEPDAALYARIVRGVRRIPGWSDRLRALGNAVVVQVPMLIGSCVQRYESRSPLAAHALTAVSGGGGQGRDVPAQAVAVPQDSRHLSPVGTKFETLGVEGTRRAYTELNAALEGLASRFVRTMEEIIPYLERMQRLLSQRGADRRMVLRKAGLPTWTEWAEAYARSLHCTLRTVQRHILLVRQEQEPKALGPASPGERADGGALNRVRLDIRQQAELVKAQMAANGLAAALRQGTDWHAALEEFERVAVAPAVMDGWLEATSRQPDWKGMLVSLVDALEPCAESLPDVVRNVLRSTEAALGDKTGTGTTCGGKATHALAVRPHAWTEGYRQGAQPGCVPADITQGGAAPAP